MKKPEVIELLRKFVISEDNLYPLLNISAKDLLDYIDYQDNIINELEKYGKQRSNEYEEWKDECKNLCYIKGITEMLDKLQELKDSGKE